MTCSLLHPGLILILTGLFIPLFKDRLRIALILIVPLLALASIWSMPMGSSCGTSYLGFDLQLIQLDNLSRLFITVFALTVFTGSLFCCRQTKAAELAAAFIYASTTDIAPPA